MDTFPVVMSFDVPAGQGLGSVAVAGNLRYVNVSFAPPPAAPPPADDEAFTVYQHNVQVVVLENTSRPIVVVANLIYDSGTMYLKVTGGGTVKVFLDSADVNTTQRSYIADPSHPNITIPIFTAHGRKIKHG